MRGLLSRMFIQLYVHCAPVLNHKEPQTNSLARHSGGSAACTSQSAGSVPASERSTQLATLRAGIDR
jgi:hypothetical protein